MSNIVKSMSKICQKNITIRKNVKKYNNVKKLSKKINAFLLLSCQKGIVKKIRSFSSYVST